MWKALVWKELRETSGIAAAGVVAYLWFATSAMGIQLLPFSLFTRPRQIPFLDDTILVAWGMISAALAVGLAARQSVGESWGGTFHFLLHRPLAREYLLGLKMLVGSGVTLLLGALALGAYAWWAATPGTHASPFEWTMTYPYWHAWISMPLLYLGAFLSGIRPAHWFGTRLLPLAAAAAVAALIQVLPYWSLVGLPAVALTCAVLVGSSLHVARTRDYS